MQERQWVITQARRGAITEGDMDLQLRALQVQEWGYEQEINELKSVAAARQQVEAAQEYVTRYLDGLAIGLDSLDIDLNALTDDQLKPLAQEYAAWRFVEKFPGDQRKQTGWAILEEKRRVVRALISRIVIERTPQGGRAVTPILSVDIPIESLAYGDQSLAYIERRVTSGE